VLSLKSSKARTPYDKLKKLDEPKTKVRYLTEDEEDRLLNQCDDVLASIIMIGIYAGLRISAEALTMEWDIVDFKNKTVTVLAAYSKNGETESVPMNSRL
jgi:integrase